MAAILLPYQAIVAGGVHPTGPDLLPAFGNQLSAVTGGGQSYVWTDAGGAGTWMANNNKAATTNASPAFLYVAVIIPAAGRYLLTYTVSVLVGTLRMVSLLDVYENGPGTYTQTGTFSGVEILRVHAYNFSGSTVVIDSITLQAY